MGDNNGNSKTVTAFHDLVAGGIAGSASIVVGHPFDTVKVRMQVAKPKGAVSLSSLTSGFGGISSLFRGLAAPLYTAALVNAVIFAAYGSSARIWDKYVAGISADDNNNNNSNGTDELLHDPWPKALVCGTFAGFPQCFVIGPTEHLKCRLQVQHGKGSADEVFRGPMQATRVIVQQHGITGLFRGFWVTVLREVPAFGGYFVIYNSAKDVLTTWWSKHRNNNNGNGGGGGFVGHNDYSYWFCSILAGGLSGSISWAMIYPVDVIKTNIQTAPLDTPRSERTIWSVGQRLVRQHGWRYMFRGLGVTVVRAFPVNGTIFPVYELTLSQITKF